MDKRVALWAGLTVLGFLVMTKTQLLNVLIAFLIMGVIPGTNLVIPAWIIFIVYPLVFLAILGWLGAHAALIGAPTPQPVKNVVSKKKRNRSKQALKREPRTAI